MTIFELAHHMDLVPVLAVLLVSRSRTVPLAAWLLACAWSVSWAGSSIQHFAPGLWWPSYVWLAVQFTLALAAFCELRPLALVTAGILAALAFVATASAAISAPGPDVLLTVVGSAALVVLARGRWRPAVYLYWGLGSVCYLVMTREVMPAWYAYQGARALAYTAFIGALVVRAPVAARA